MMNNPMKMGEEALVQLEEIRKQLSIRNVLDLAIIRHKAACEGLHLPNGAEMDDQEYWECIEDLWNAATDTI